MTEVPRSYSVDQPDFDPAVGCFLEVSLDGDVVKQVLAYDIDTGTVTRPKTDEGGRIVVDPQTEEIVTEVLTGQVSVQNRSGLKPAT